MGKLLTCLPRLTLVTQLRMLRATTGSARRRDLEKFPKVPIAPMGNSPFARCLQGGGVAVYGGSVSIVNSQIYSNSANGVRARVRTPMGTLLTRLPHSRLHNCG
jgi:hypothetical protein